MTGPDVRADALGQAQQAVQGRGVQFNYYSGTGGRTAVALDTLVPPPVLVGRDAELQRLQREGLRAREAGRPVVMSAVHGMGGAGKTALARALAAEIGEQFPDGRFEVDLRGFTPGHRPRDPGEVLGELLALVGFAPAEIPADAQAKGGLWRGWLAERRVLLILDNARDAAQVRPLLPGPRTSAGCLVVVTSRDRLTELEAAVRIGVDTLSVSDAVALLVGVAGRSQEEMAARDGELAELAGLCGCLPLALRPAGSLLAVLSAAEVIEVMRSAEHPLEHLEDVDQVVQAAFTASYSALPPALRRALGVCARHPGPNFDAASVAALAGRPRPLAAVQLARLLERNLLIGLPQGRYTFHDLFLGYARRTTDYANDDPEVRQGRRRLYEHLEAAVYSASAALTKQSMDQAASDQFGTPPEARAWLTAASDELTVAAQTALSEEWEQANAFVDHVAFWLTLDNKPEQAARLYSAGHAAACDAGDLRGQANALAGLGRVARIRNDFDQADGCLRSALRLHRELGDRAGQAPILLTSGFVAQARADLGEAEAYFRQALQHYGEAGNRLGQADALLASGRVARLLGELDRAHACHQQAFEHYRELEDRLGQAHTFIALGDVALARGNLGGAEAYGRRALQLHEMLEDRSGQAGAFRGLGDVARARRDFPQASAHYRRASELFQELDDRGGQAQIRMKLAQLAECQGHHDEARRQYRHAADLYREIKLNKQADDCAEACARITGSGE
ncbi:tetratricopeptide repeat protein [Spirillospora sp. NPDC127506]